MTQTATSELALPSDSYTDAGAEAGQSQRAPRAFAFGDAESVLDRRDLAQFFEIWHNGRWYEPPMPMGRLAQVFNMTPYHRSAVGLKVNMLVAQQVATRWLDSDSFERFAQDFIQMGNGYLEYVPNMAGRMARAAYAPAVHLRAGVAEGQFWFVNQAKGIEHAFAPGAIYQLQQPDVAQEVYGMPEWLAALQSGLLAENATLFRRRYYLNGAHVGSVLYWTDTVMDEEALDTIEETLTSAKGVGNFKNMLIHVPGGSKDGFRILPIADAQAKDEFYNVKTISRDDMLAAHRIPPQLLGIVPQNNGGFGKVGEARDSFFETEILPIQQRMLRMNARFGVPLLAFRDYVCSDGTVIAQDGTKTRPGSNGAARR